MPRSANPGLILADTPIKTGPPPALSITMDEQKNRRIEDSANTNPVGTAKVKVGYYLDPELAQSMRQVALNQRRRVSSVVEDALREYLRQNRDRKNSPLEE